MWGYRNVWGLGTHTLQPKLVNVWNMQKFFILNTVLPRISNIRGGVFFFLSRNIIFCHALDWFQVSHFWVYLTYQPEFYAFLWGEKLHAKLASQEGVKATSLIDIKISCVESFKCGKAFKCNLPPPVQSDIGQKSFATWFTWVCERGLQVQWNSMGQKFIQQGYSPCDFIMWEDS